MIGERLSELKSSRCMIIAWAVRPASNRRHGASPLELCGESFAHRGRWKISEKIHCLVDIRPRVKLIPGA